MRYSFIERVKTDLVLVNEKKINQLKKKEILSEEIVQIYDVLVAY